MSGNNDRPIYRIEITRWNNVKTGSKMFVLGPFFSKDKNKISKEVAKFLLGQRISGIDDFKQVMDQVNSQYFGGLRTTVLGDGENASL